jgi:hypothetical protein
LKGLKAVAKDEESVYSLSEEGLSKLVVAKRLAEVGFDVKVLRSAEAVLAIKA